VFDPITATSKKVAGAAVLPGGTMNTLGDSIVIGRKVCLPVSGKDFGFADWIPCAGGKLFIGPGLFMADKTIDFGLIRKVKVFSFPSISGMARCATSLVALNVNSEVVDRQPSFSKFFVPGRRRIHPGPVDGFMKLKRRLRMARKTGFGNLRTGRKLLFQNFMLGMVGSNPALLNVSCLLGHFSAGSDLLFRVCHCMRRTHQDNGSKQKRERTAQNFRQYMF